MMTVFVEQPLAMPSSAKYPWELEYSIVKRVKPMKEHIVPCGKFHRIGGAPPETFSSENYDAPEEVGGDRKSFDSPI